jgi:hypothetical protein
LSDQDSFADPVFMERLTKLLPMLGSSQVEEADTARRMLVAHLSHHHLSMTDLAERLRAPVPAAPPPRPAPRSPSEAELVRELDLTRHARAAAEEWAHKAAQENMALRKDLERANDDLQRLASGRGVARVLAAAGMIGTVGLAAVLGAEQFLPLREHSAAIEAVATPDADHLPVTMRYSFSDAAPSPSPGPAAPGELVGAILLNDLAIHAAPSADSPIRIYLQRGTQVVILRDLVDHGLDWSEVRAGTTTGFVPSGAVLR